MHVFFLVFLFFSFISLSSLFFSLQCCSLSILPRPLLLEYLGISLSDFVLPPPSSSDALCRHLHLHTTLPNSCPPLPLYNPTPTITPSPLLLPLQPLPPSLAHHNATVTSGMSDRSEGTSRTQICPTIADPFTDFCCSIRFRVSVSVGGGGSWNGPLLVHNWGGWVNWMIGLFRLRMLVDCPVGGERGDVGCFSSLGFFVLVKWSRHGFRMMSGVHRM